MYQEKRPSAIEQLKNTWDEKPLLVIGVAVAAMTAVAKLIDAVSSAQGRRAYAKQINMRAKASRRS